jgi:RES domain-containing protein
LATLEILAGLRTPAVIPAYVLIPVEFDEAFVTELDVRKLRKGWQDSPPGDATQRLGDRWIEAAESAVLRVPSAVVPSEFNYVLNPAHLDFARIRIGRAEELYFG